MQHISRATASPILLAALFHVAAAAAAAAQPPAAPLTVVGTVVDSIRGVPLAGADIQLAETLPSGAPGTRLFMGKTDSAGVYRIEQVPAGTYIAGVFHPRIDSLGLVVPPKQVAVQTGAPRIDFALPSTATVLNALCPGRAADDTTSLLLGYVRDAGTAEPRAGATVQIRWSRFVLTKKSVQADRPEISVPTRPNGWFAVCGVPPEITLAVRAIGGRDTSAALEFPIPRGAVIHRDLYLGGDAATAGGVVRGTVRAAGGRLVSDARVSVDGVADSVLTNGAGEFSVARAPLGSRMLRVRAIGYVPLVQIVDVTPGAAAPVEVRLVDARSYLDTMRIVQQRVYDRDATGFAQRSKASGSGYFMDRTTLDRYTTATQAMDFVRMVPGVFMDANRTLTMRANGGGSCAPEIYLDGMLFAPPPGAATVIGASPRSNAPSSINGVPSVDMLVSPLYYLQPDEIAAIEVYSHASTAPALFSTMQNGCGSIVIWTRRTIAPARSAR